MDWNVIVGLCTKNESKSIRLTIRSIVAQDRKPDKIVVCDASDDRTREIIQSELRQTGIPYEILRQSKYSGPGGARQELFERVRDDDMDVFCALDSNHTVEGDWLKRLLEFWEENPEYDVLTGAEYGSDVHRECESLHDPLYYRHANIAFKTDVLREVGGWDPWFNRGEDWDLGIRLWRSGARVFTSGNWGSRESVESDWRTAYARIKGNPTSLPYLAKYGRSYVSLHPGQIGKDLLSIVLYMLLGTAGVLSLRDSSRLSSMAMIVLGYVLSYVGVYHLYAFATESGRNRFEIRRPLFILVLSAPAACRSAVRMSRSAPDKAPNEENRESA